MAEVTGGEPSLAGPGYLPEEIERGEDRPGCHAPLWGCIPAGAGLALALYGLYRLAIGIGVAASAGL